MTSILYRRTIKEILDTIPGIEQTYGWRGIAMFNTPQFYIRIIDDCTGHVEIQMGERKTFDRWANSINFITKRSKARMGYYAVFLHQYRWAIKVVKSGLFAFDNYFHRIELPWFKTERNK